MPHERTERTAAARASGAEEASSVVCALAVRQVADDRHHVARLQVDHLVRADLLVKPSDLREGMTLELRWTDATDRFGEHNLPAFGPPSKPG